MTVPVVHAFDGRQRVVLDDPSDIKPGDWLPDLGTLRQVATVDVLGVKVGPGVLYILHFEPQPGVKNLARGISGGTKEITVWRGERHESAPQPTCSTSSDQRSGPPAVS